MAHRKLFLFVVIAITGIWQIACDNQQPEMEEPAAEVTPVPFPDTGIPGFEFPADSTVINQWVATQNDEEIYKHGWGIWAGLTAPTDQHIGGFPLLVFETWLTPKEIIDRINGTPQPRTQSGRALLNIPNQFVHAADFTGGEVDTKVFESVSYSPAAADFALDNKIFLYTTLAQYAGQGLTEIPDFPSDAITIKPVFKVIAHNELGPDGIFTMPVWHGPIDSVAAFPETVWGTCIHINVNNGAAGDGGIDPNCSNPNPSNTYNLTDFIHYDINEEDVDYYNEQFGLGVQPGDHAVLVAMHVTSREILRWTWQTFWWTPAPANPPAPSSAEIAGLMPAEYLHGAAAHYAMAAAYSMVVPAQPYYNGESVGDTLIAFNPYLEAGFGPDVFTGSDSYVIKDGNRIPTDAGIRTNCMSCHAFASYNLSEKKSTTPYSGDAYVSLHDPKFEGSIRLDFAWSIASNVDTTGMQAFIDRQSAGDD